MPGHPRQPDKWLKGEIHHVGVSVARLPCNRRQTPTVHHHTGQKSNARRGAALSCWLGGRPECSWKRWQRSIVYQSIGWRWCHARMGWFEASRRASKRCGSRLHDAGGQSNATAPCQPSHVLRRAGPQSWSPHLCPAATARQIPTVSLSLLRATLETSFSLIRPPKSCLIHALGTIVNIRATTTPRPLST